MLKFESKAFLPCETTTLQLNLYLKTIFNFEKSRVCTSIRSLNQCNCAITSIPGDTEVTPIWPVHLDHSERPWLVYPDTHPGLVQSPQVILPNPSCIHFDVVASQQSNHCSIQIDLDLFGAGDVVRATWYILGLNEAASF